MTTAIVKRSLPVPREPANRVAIEALRVAVSELSGSIGSSAQRAVRLCELLDVGILKMSPEGLAMSGVLPLKGGGTLTGGSLILDYRGDTTSVFSVYGPGDSGDGVVHISSPGGEPGLIGISRVLGRRTDIRFNDDGLEIGASSTGAGATPQFRFDNAGRISGTALHNNAAGVAGTTRQYIASGTYTPTLTPVANVDTATPSLFKWLRVGNVVYCAGRIDVDATAAANTLTQVGISLPIASALTLATQLTGGGGVGNTPYTVALVSGDLTNDRAVFGYHSASTGNVGCLVTFFYLVL